MDVLLGLHKEELKRTGLFLCVRGAQMSLYGADYLQSHIDVAAATEVQLQRVRITYGGLLNQTSTRE